MILVCGKREAEEATVNMRRLGSRDQESLALDAAVEQLRLEAIPPDLRRNCAGKRGLEFDDAKGGKRISRPFFMTPVTIHDHLLGMLNVRRKEILFPELSYANADHTRLKRWFIRSVEGLSGRDRYARALRDLAA